MSKGKWFGRWVDHGPGGLVMIRRDGGAKILVKASESVRGRWYVIVNGVTVGHRQGRTSAKLFAREWAKKAELGGTVTT